MVNLLHTRHLILGVIVGALMLAGCGNLEEQPKLDEPYAESPAFGTAAREILPEAVAIDSLNEDEHLYQGTVNGELATSFPFEITAEGMADGKVNYEAYCTPCHGVSGYGDGVVVAEGLQQPPSFHGEELRDAPVGRYFQAMTYGQGGMFSYASRIEVEDRWEIIAYIEAMQLSQNANYDDLPPELQSEFDQASQ